MGRPRLRADWNGIKDDYCRGDMTVPQIAQKWRIKASTISSAASRYDWPTPCRVRRKMQEAVNIAAAAVVQSGSESGVQGFKFEPIKLAKGRVAKIPANSPQAEIISDPAKYQQLVAEFAMTAVSRGLSKLPAPKNWRELATADTIARRAAGLDKVGGGVAALVRVTGGGAGNPMDISVGVITQGEPMAEMDMGEE